MNTFLRSVTFAPFVKGMPAFLHNFIYLDFGADCSDYHVIFITDLCARQERSRESVDGHKQGIHAHQNSKLSLKASYYNKGRCLGASFLSMQQAMCMYFKQMYKLRACIDLLYFSTSNIKGQNWLFMHKGVHLCYSTHICKACAVMNRSWWLLYIANNKYESSFTKMSVWVKGTLFICLL